MTPRLALVFTVLLCVAYVVVLWHCNRVLKQNRETLKLNRDVLDRYRSELMTLAIVGVELSTNVGNLKRDATELARRIASLERSRAGM